MISAFGRATIGGGALTRYLVNSLLAMLPPTRFFAMRRYFLRFGGVDVAQGVSLTGHGWIYGRGALSIGRDTWLSPRVIIYTHPEAPIAIGDRCDIGPGVEFVTGSHSIAEGRRRAGEGNAKSISIGDGCWIGARSIILGGVTVGDGAVVAAGSVVVHDVTPHTLVAGVPAVFKRSLCNEA